MSATRNGDDAQPGTVGIDSLGEPPPLPPPAVEVGVRGWLWRNLIASMARYGSPAEAARSVFMLAATVVILYGAATAAFVFVDFALINAVWEAHVADDVGARPGLACAPQSLGGVFPEGWRGACYPYLSEAWTRLIYGDFPIAELWRVNAVFLGAALAIAWLTMDALPRRRGVGVRLILFGVGLSLLDGYMFGNDPATVGVPLLYWFNAGFDAWFGSFIGTPIKDLLGASISQRIGFQIMIAVGLLFAFGPSRPPKRWVAWALALLGPFLGFVLLTGGDAPIAPGLFGVLGFIAAIAFGFAAAARRGYLGEVGLEFFDLARRTARSFGLVFLALWLCSVDYGLNPVPSAAWGGLTLALVIAVGGFALAAPLGVLLALGRRSHLPVVRAVSTTLVIAGRAAPLLVLLFLAVVVTPLLWPDVEAVTLLRAAFFAVAFSGAARVADVVTGGLRAIPRGHEEAAAALGLPYWRRVRLILLPQALSRTQPRLITTFNALFKDATLISIIGLADLAGVAHRATGDDAWATPMQTTTVFIVVALIYWLLCGALARYAAFLERRAAAA